MGVSLFLFKVTNSLISFAHVFSCILVWTPNSKFSSYFISLFFFYFSLSLSLSLSRTFPIISSNCVMNFSLFFFSQEISKIFRVTKGIKELRKRNERGKEREKHIRVSWVNKLKFSLSSPHSSHIVIIPQHLEKIFFFSFFCIARKRLSESLLLLHFWNRKKISKSYSDVVIHSLFFSLFLSPSPASLSSSSDIQFFSLRFCWIEFQASKPFQNHFLTFLFLGKERNRGRETVILIVLKWEKKEKKVFKELCQKFLFHFLAVILELLFWSFSSRQPNKNFLFSHFLFIFLYLFFLALFLLTIFLYFDKEKKKEKTKGEREREREREREEEGIK